MVEMLNFDLATIWLLLIGFFLLYYALTDGADLGIGILTLVNRNRQERQTMLHTIESFWHGNQTWLVVLGGMLFGAFPLFYSIVLSALYLPFSLMLFGLIFRGVAFEFYANARHKSIWLLSFGLGSLLTTLAQGFALGGLLSGIRVKAEAFAGEPWDWATWYTAIATAGVLCGYLMLGANFLGARSTGALRAWSLKAATISGTLTLVVSMAVFVGTSALHQAMAAKWTAWPPSALYLFLLLTAGSYLMFFRSLGGQQKLAPLVWNWLIIIFSFTALSLGLYPQMIPGISGASLTVQEVAASPLTLRFMLGATAVLLPIILVYTSYSYRVLIGGPRPAGPPGGTTD